MIGKRSGIDLKKLDAADSAMKCTPQNTTYSARRCSAAKRDNPKECREHVGELDHLFPLVVVPEDEEALSSAALAARTRSARSVSRRVGVVVGNWHSGGGSLGTPYWTLRHGRRGQPGRPSVGVSA